jgi:hypothetical protein
LTLRVRLSKSLFKSDRQGIEDYKGTGSGEELCRIIHDMCVLLPVLKLSIISILKLSVPYRFASGELSLSARNSSVYFNNIRLDIASGLSIWITPVHCCHGCILVRLYRRLCTYLFFAPGPCDFTYRPGAVALAYLVFTVYASPALSVYTLFQFFPASNLEYVMLSCNSLAYCGPPYDNGIGAYIIGGDTLFT